MIDKTWVMEAENGILCSLLLNNDSFDKVAAFLRPEHFSSVFGSRVYKTISDALSAGESCDVITVYESLSRKSPELGISIEDLANIASGSSLGVMIHQYATSLVEHYQEKKLLEAINKAYESAADQSLPIADRVAIVTSMIDSATQEKQNGKEPVLIGDLIEGYLAKLENNAGGVDQDFVPTGFEKLDEYFGGGFRNGKVYVLAARPSIGKSAVAQAACEAGAKCGIPTAMFSQEMTNAEMVERSISRVGGVSMGFHNGKSLDNQNFDNAMEAAQILGKLPLWLFDGAGLRIQEIASRARQLKRKNGLGLLAIDYIQLCQSVNPKLSRHHQIEEISRGIKVLAKELDIPILVLSQLNRKVEERNPPRPIMSDLKESGAIEEDADAIIFMWPHRVGESDTLLGFDIAKNRGGAKGAFGVRFVGKYQQFHDTDESINAPQKKERGKGSYGDDF